MALNRLPIKLTALLVSFVLWLAVSAQEPTDEWVPVHVELSMDSSVALRTPIPVVRALVVGPARELFKLYIAQPTMRATIGADVDDSLTLTLRPHDVKLPTQVAAAVNDVQPSAITLHFAVSATRRLPVRSQLRLRADSGWRITGRPDFSPESVTVRGARAVVRQLASVPTMDDELLVRDTMPQPALLDTAGLGVRVDPILVRVKVPVERVTALADSTAADSARISARRRAAHASLPASARSPRVAP